METSEYSLIQFAQTQNAQRKLQAKQLQAETKAKSKPTEPTPQLEEELQLIVTKKQVSNETEWSPLEQQTPQIMHTQSLDTQISASMFSGGITRNKTVIQDQQQIYLRRTKLRMVIIFLCAASMFGNPAPLQNEIQEHMMIGDTEFNSYYSAKSFSSMLPPIVMLLFSGKKLSLKYMMVFFSLCCAVGQAMFTLGLGNVNQSLCVWGRFFIGFSDTLTIMQQTIMCMWFPTSQLPYAFGLMLFLVKIVRTTNDQFASVFFNQIGLLPYFWFGFALCIFSVISSIICVQIHDSVMEDPVAQEQAKKDQEAQPARTGLMHEVNQVTSVMKSLPRKFWIFCIVDAFGYSSVHAFYPNMSKFFQEKFDFANTEAGVISSIPYGIASFTVPLIGSFLRGKSDKVYEDSLLGGLLIIFSCHTFYLIILEHLQWQWIAVAPIFFFGIGHAVFTTLVPTTTTKILDNKAELLPIGFSILKVSEGFAITFFTQVAGALRQMTGSYTCVSVELMITSLIALIATLELSNPNAGIIGNIQQLRIKLMDLVSQCFSSQSTTQLKTETSSEVESPVSQESQTQKKE